MEDVFYPFLKYYNNSPQWVRTTAGRIYRSIPLSIRYGRTYTHYKKLLNHTPYLNDEEKNRYIITELRKSLINAYENTDYYEALFRSVNFDPYKFSHPEELSAIPFTDKDTLRQHKAELKNRSIPENKLLYVTTGGTSGIPVEAYYLKGVERSREFVFMNSQWQRVGYRMSERIAVIRGGVVDHKGNQTYFKFEPVKNRLLLSTYDLYEDNMEMYIQKLKEFKPRFIHTYPSAITVLAKYILREKVRFEGLKGLFCSSEQFYPGQRELIEEAFGARVYSWYGHTEGTTLAGECEDSKLYHIFFEYGYTELIDISGKPITEPGIQGEITGTSFEMKGFPIIRYKTGDFAEYAEGKCKCGRNYTLITNVKGRWHQENIITKKNSGISLTMLNMHTDLFDNVVQYQFYQKEVGKVMLLIIRNDRYSENDENKILESFNEKFKELVDFSIVYVEKIDRTRVGKHRFLIQEIPSLQTPIDSSFNIL